MAEKISLSKKKMYLGGLNEALVVHKHYKQGMHFYDLVYQKDLLIFLVKPVGITSDVEAMSALTDIANILTLSGETIKFDIAEGIA